jgi:urease accessory protein
MGTAMITTDSVALLRLLQVCSPALPIGGFSYSRGLEGAHAQGLVTDEGTALDWIRGVGAHLVAPTDGPLLLRLCLAWRGGSLAEVKRWEAYGAALRETEELWLEDDRLGTALFKLLDGLGEPRAQGRKGPYASAFALWVVRHGIADAHALLGFFWTFAESQVSVAVRLIPLGQTAGQRLLSALLAELPGWVERASGIDDAHIGQTGAGLGLASAAHETQYSRLFRS